jgi:hypothetical protein
MFLERDIFPERDIYRYSETQSFVFPEMALELCSLKVIIH